MTDQDWTAELSPQHFVGAFEVPEGSLIVSDPCYDPGTWCTVKIGDALAGTWHAFTERRDLGRWGARVSALEARHVSVVSEPDRAGLVWMPVDGEAGVDSGQCGIWRHDAPLGQGEYGRPGFYGAACEATSYPSDDVLCDGGMPRGGMVSTDGVVWGAVSASGFGDGGYEVSVARDGTGHTVAVRVEYLTAGEGPTISEDVARAGWLESVAERKREIEERNWKIDDLVNRAHGLIVNPGSWSD